MHAKTISKGVVSLGTWSVVKILASAIASPLLTRILGAEGYGLYASYLAILFLASPVANLGTSQSLTKTIAEGPEDVHWRRKTALYILRLNTLGVLLVGGSVTAVVYWHAPGGASRALLTATFIGSLVLEQAFYFSRGILYGLHREELAGIPAAIGSVISPAVGVALAAYGLGVFGVAAGLLTGDLCVAILTLTFTIRSLAAGRTAATTETHPLPTAGIFSFGLTSMLFAVLSMALYRADIILVRILAHDTADAGLYATAVQLSEFVWVIPLAVEGIMLQSTARLWAENRTDRITDILSRLLRYTALGTSFLLAIVTVFASDILRLYFGAPFAGADTALLILIPGVFSFSLARVMWPVIQAKGKVLPLVSVVGVATLVNIVLNLLCIPRWGAEGAAIAASISYGGVAFAYVWLLRARSVHPLQGLSLIRLAITFGLAIAAMTLVRLIPIPPILALATGCVAASAAYAIGTLSLGLLSVSEIHQIIETLPAIVKRPALISFETIRPLLDRIERRFVDAPEPR
ncbi:MAG: flippase [Candidatus Hydrogenedentes bacterium]|nr:flippase [Candidatus Hydrogenedentota bacterium]